MRSALCESRRGRRGAMLLPRSLLSAISASFAKLWSAADQICFRSLSSCILVLCSYLYAFLALVYTCILYSVAFHWVSDQSFCLLHPSCFGFHPACQIDRHSVLRIEVAIIETRQGVGSKGSGSGNGENGDQSIRSFRIYAASCQDRWEYEMTTMRWESCLALALWIRNAYVL